MVPEPLAWGQRWRAFSPSGRYMGLCAPLSSQKASGPPHSPRRWVSTFQQVLHSITHPLAQASQRMPALGLAHELTQASLAAQAVKNPPAMQETHVQSLSQEDPLEEGNGSPLQYFCLGHPIDGGAWWATVHGSQRVRHD